MAPAAAAVTPEQAFQLLQKFGIQALLDPNQKTLVVGPDHNANVNANTITTLNDASSSAGGLAVASTPFPEEHTRSLTTPRDETITSLQFEPYTPSAPFGRQTSSFGLPNLSQSRLPMHSSFSPFSPDPNQFGDSSKRTFGLPFTRSEHLPHPSRNYVPGFGPLSHDPKIGTNGKSSPTSTRPPSRSRYGPYLESLSSTNKTAAEQEGTGTSLSRPPSSEMSHSSHDPRGYEGTDHDPIHDLNGTLASLDLDQNSVPPWSSPVTKPDLGVNWGMSRLKPSRSPHLPSPSP